MTYRDNQPPQSQSEKDADIYIYEKEHEYLLVEFSWYGDDGVEKNQIEFDPEPVYGAWRDDVFVSTRHLSDNILVCLANDALQTKLEYGMKRGYIEIVPGLYVPWHRMISAIVIDRKSKWLWFKWRKND